MSFEMRIQNERKTFMLNQNIYGRISDFSFFFAISYKFVFKCMFGLIFFFFL